MAHGKYHKGKLRAVREDKCNAIAPAVPEGVQRGAKDGNAEVVDVAVGLEGPAVDQRKGNATKDDSIGVIVSYPPLPPILPRSPPLLPLLLRGILPCHPRPPTGPRGMAEQKVGNLGRMALATSLPAIRSSNWRRWDTRPRGG